MDNSNLIIKICFCGDIMPGGVLPYQEKYIDDDTMLFLKQFDLRVGTLECGIGTDAMFDETKMSKTKGIVYARNNDLKRLKEMNINVVTLANNHAFDLGLKGFDNTKHLLDNLGILYCGAGNNITEAKKPATLTLKGKRFAFIGCMLDVPIPAIFHKASESDYGVYQVGIDVIAKDIVQAKLNNDYVIVMPHWGEEHSYTPPAYCKMCAKRMIDAGADAIIGSHPHVINPVIKYRGKYCYFSLGNFLFPEKCMQVPRPMYYPETNEELQSLKRMWTYPKSISEPIVAVWKPKNRIGLMVEMQINDEIRCHYQLTCLSADNILHLYSSLIVRLRMIFWSILIHLPKYSFVRRIYNHRYNLLSRSVDKLPAFNIPVKL